MPTRHQILGARGETLVAQRCRCPRCERSRTLKRLPTNFTCADLICDFCGFLAQVKSANCTDPNCIPKRLLGAAWSVQNARMDAGIFFPLFLVLINARKHVIYYLSADLQRPEMFLPRKRCQRAHAERAGRASNTTSPPSHPQDWSAFELRNSEPASAGLLPVS